jgi:hypothetical protein
MQDHRLSDDGLISVKGGVFHVVDDVSVLLCLFKYVKYEHLSDGERVDLLETTENELRSLLEEAVVVPYYCLPTHFLAKASYFIEFIPNSILTFSYKDHLLYIFQF